MIDFNARLGHWPYRPVRGLDALLNAMDAFGIERALVSSLSAVHYLNPQDGNDELARWIAPHRDRLVQAAVLRPNFTGWRDDLEKCVSEYEIRAVVLYPNYHRFDLSDARLAPLMARAASRGFPVCVQAGLEDPRRQFYRKTVWDVPADDIGTFASRYPDIRVVAMGLKVGQPDQTGDPPPENLLFELSNCERMGEVEAILGQFGAERLLFGTNFPLFSPRANVDKLARADIPDEDRRVITSENAARLLG